MGRRGQAVGSAHAARAAGLRAQLRSASTPVSYTHLTLPTICSV